MSVFAHTRDLWQWVTALSPDQAFLFALPFAVALLALAVDCLRARSLRRD
jgi:hypothetical protein